MRAFFYLLATSYLINLSCIAQCHKQLIRVVDKFSDKTVVATTCRGNRSAEPVHYKRITEKGQTQYFVQLYADGGTFLPRHGAVIAFTDGTRLEWLNAEVKSVLRGAAYISQCSIRLNEDQIELIQQKDIALIKLHTHERLLTSRQSQRAKDSINCVIGADLIELKSDQVVSQ